MKPFSRQFPEDVWCTIAWHVQRPMPLPLSKPSGRQAFQQPDLASLARTSKALQPIAEKLIYTHLYTDCFMEVVNSTDIHTPGRRFAYTRSLHLEYMPRNEEPTYKMLFEIPPANSAMWEMYGIGAWPSGVLRNACIAEIAGLTEAFDELCGMTMATAFPKLETIAIDAIYASGTAIWLPYEQSWHSEAESKPLGDVCQLFHRFLIGGNLQSVCMRGSNGPMSLDYMTYRSELEEEGRPMRFAQTVHFDRDTMCLALPLGQNVRWVADVAAADDMADPLHGLAQSCTALVRHRESLAGMYARQGWVVPRDAADVDIYCSTDQYGPKMHDLALKDAGLDLFKDGPIKFTMTAMAQMDKVEMIGKLQAKLQKLFRRSSGRNDEVRWHLSEEAARCRCCGSGGRIEEV